MIYLQAGIHIYVSIILNTFDFEHLQNKNLREEWTMWPDSMGAKNLFS